MQETDTKENVETSEKIVYPVVDYVTFEELSDENRFPIYFSKGSEVEWFAETYKILDLDNQEHLKLIAYMSNLVEGFSGVRSIHFENPHKNGCDSCGDGYNQVSWPCETIKALDLISEDTHIDYSNFEVTTILVDDNGEEIAELTSEEEANA